MLKPAPDIADMARVEGSTVRLADVLRADSIFLRPHLSARPCDSEH